MGGYGSGRHGGRATVEGCRSLKLDVNRVTRAARAALRNMPEGRPITAGPSVWNWTMPGEAVPWARVLVSLRLDRWHGEARLKFDVDHGSRKTGLQDQVVQMETTPCQFGGRRWWWLCPATRRRCATLYLPNGGTYFLSRAPGAYRLAYASQSNGPLERSHRRVARVHQKLGGECDTPYSPLPGRPKWMRHLTYERLMAEWEVQIGRHGEIWFASAKRLASRGRP